MKFGSARPLGERDLPFYMLVGTLMGIREGRTLQKEGRAYARPENEVEAGWSTYRWNPRPP